MSIEISLEDRIEEARAKLKTAYDALNEPGLNNPRTYEVRLQKWLQRKKELEFLINRQKQTL